MAYCHECGSRMRKGAMFCGKCGTPVKNKKARRVALIAFSITIFFVLYIILDIYAIGRILPSNPPEINTNYSITLISQITLKNPTIIPVLCSRVTYGDKGRTGFVFIMPYSKINTTMTVEVNRNFNAMLGPIRIQIGDEQ
jgi:hypothetical protein